MSGKLDFEKSLVLIKVRQSFNNLSRLAGVFAESKKGKPVFVAASVLLLSPEYFSI